MAGGDIRIDEMRSRKNFKKKQKSNKDTSKGEEKKSQPNDKGTSLDLEKQSLGESTFETTDLDSIEDHGLPYSYYYDDAQELYEAATTTKEADDLAHVVARISAAKGLSQQAILRSLSPLEYTLLHAAANAGNAETLAWIVSRSYDHDHERRSVLLNKQNLKGDTALHVAAKAGHGVVVRELIRIWRSLLSGHENKSVAAAAAVASAADLLKEENDEGNTAASAAALLKQENDEGNTAASAADLLKQENKEGNTALHEALINGHVLLAIDLIEADPEVSLCLNSKDKSPLYIAAESGYLNCIQHMLLRLKHCDVSVHTDERLKKKSPILAAVSHDARSKRTEVLSIMLSEEGRFIQSSDTKGRTAIHYAASIGYLAGVHFLIIKCGACVYQRDSKGFFPIHMASLMGHVDVVEELLHHCRDPGDMLNHKWQNILHVAAESGRENVVSYILKNPELQKLVNQRDKDGNTPLHLATTYWNPKVVSILTWDKRVDLNLTNKEGLTALDSSLYYMEEMPSFRERLTWMALNDVGAPKASSAIILDGDPIRRQASMNKRQPRLEKYKNRVDTLLLVSILVATVTFAAGFTMPGGFNGSTDSNPGMAVMLKHRMLHVFVFCDTAAMYSSIMVAIVLIWAQLGDLHLVSKAVQVGVPLLGFALTMMSLAFTAGTCLVLVKLNWLYIALLVMGLVFLSAVLLLFLPLCPSLLPPSRDGIIRYVHYFHFWLLLRATGCHTTSTSTMED